MFLTSTLLNCPKPQGLCGPLPSSLPPGVGCTTSDTRGLSGGHRQLLESGMNGALTWAHSPSLQPSSGHSGLNTASPPASSPTHTPVLSPQHLTLQPNEKLIIHQELPHLPALPPTINAVYQKLLVTPHSLCQEHNYRNLTQIHSYLSKDYIPSYSGCQVGR